MGGRVRQGGAAYRWRCVCVCACIAGLVSCCTYVGLIKKTFAQKMCRYVQQKMCTYVWLRDNSDRWSVCLV
ncbi:MAG: hypothetical protein ACK55Z_14080, partial [bacterium]